MASTANLFDALVGAGEAPQSAKKAKKKNKSKAAKPDTLTPAVESAASASSNGGAFVKADTAQRIAVAEACALLEKGARVAKTDSERVNTWKSWIKQTSEKGSDARKYQDSDGSTLSFKQVLLRSQALEVALEGCLSSPLSADAAAVLQQLLAAVLPRPADAPGLSASVARLSQVLDPDSFDTADAAQRALVRVLAALKAGEGGAADARNAGAGAPGWLQRLAGLEQELSKSQAVLQKMRDSGLMSRQQVESARQMVQLHAQKFDMLHQGPRAVAPPQPPAVAEGVAAVQALKAAVGARLAAARGGGGAAARGAATAAARRADDELSAQAAALAAQVRALEAQLAAVRAQAAEVEAKRASLAARAKAGGAASAPAATSVGAYEAQLAAADQLLGLLDGGGNAAAGDDVVAGVCAEQAPAAVPQYLSHVRQLMAVTCAVLADAPNRVGFCRQRLLQASKLGSLGAASKDAAARAAKQKEDAEGLLAEVKRNGEAALAASRAALEGVQARAGALLATAGPAGGVQRELQMVEELWKHLCAQDQALAAALEGQALLPPPLPSALAAVALAMEDGGVAPPPPPPQPLLAPEAPPAPPALPLQPGAALGLGLLPGQALGGQPIAAGGPPFAPPGQWPTAIAPGSYAAPVPAPIAPPAAGANGNGAAPARPRPATAAAAAAMPPADGFREVGGKKGRRRV